MKFLIIDTSSKALYIALCTENKVFTCYENDLGHLHSETLLVKLDALLNQQNLTLKEMNYFCCSIGPGSFTGIRIGITTIRAFAQVYNKPVISVNSLELKAYNIKTKGIAVPLINAVTDKYYCSAFFEGKEILSPFVYTTKELFCIKDKLPEKFKDKDINFIIENQIEGLENILLPINPPDYVAFVKEKIKQGLQTDYNSMLPVYSALSQAEVTYENNIKKLD